MKRTYTYVRSFPWDVCHGPMSKKSLPGIFWMRRRISRQCQAPSSPQTILKLCRCLHEPTQRKTCGDSELLTYVASSTSITDSRHCYFTLSTSLSLSFLFADVDFKIISDCFYFYYFFLFLFIFCTNVYYYMYNFFLYCSTLPKGLPRPNYSDR